MVSTEGIESARQRYSADCAVLLRFLMCDSVPWCHSSHTLLRGMVFMSVYSWHESYKAAVLETDWSRLHDRVRAALHEIYERTRILSENQAGTQEERQAIDGRLHSKPCQ